MVPELEAALLRRIIEAENSGKPLTMRDLGNEVKGSTFQDLYGSRIAIKGKEDVLFAQAFPDSQIVATERGKWWLQARDARSAGKKPPAPPKVAPRTVRLFG